MFYVLFYSRTDRQGKRSCNYIKTVNVGKTSIKTSLSHYNSFLVDLCGIIFVFFRSIFQKPLFCVVIYVINHYPMPWGSPCSVTQMFTEYRFILYIIFFTLLRLAKKCSLHTHTLYATVRLLWKIDSIVIKKR